MFCLRSSSGPCYLAIELAKLGICEKIIGLDMRKDFVEIAQRNAKEAGVSEAVEFQHGNVADIHFPDNSFDFNICIAAFKAPFKALRLNAFKELFKEC